jgi:adenylate cyclase
MGHRLNGVFSIKDPTGASWDIDLVQGRTYSIGRAKDNDIILNDRRVSRKHAFVAFDGGAFKIVDGHVENGQLIRSVNHVFVNGTMRLEAPLSTGDIVTIGESTLQFADREIEPVDLTLSQETIFPKVAEKQKTVNFEDSPLGHTQVKMSVADILGPRSDLSLENAVASPEEIRDLRRKAKILELLFEMSKTLGTVFNLDEIFERATDLIFRGTPADRVVALLAEDIADEGDAKLEGIDHSLYQVAAKTRDAAFEKLSEKLAVSRTITQKVMKEGVAILSQDARSDAQFHGAESIVAQGVRSTICAPLITQSGVHGVLYADRLDPFAAFRPDHLELISAVAAQTAVTVETVKAHQALAREEVARANYSRFMPEYVVKQLLENPNSFKLGGANQTITVLFADIRGFTSISENENPERIVGLLNKYFSAMSEIIFEHGGTLDKYIGDGMMALFGAPTATPEDAHNALRAAVAMQKELVELKKQEREFQKIAIGIGLHTGVATVGYIGSDRRSEYTAIGDTVNLASRLESNSQGGQILISEATATAAPDIFAMTRRDPIMVKNRLQPVELYEVKWDTEVLEPAA